MKDVGDKCVYCGVDTSYGSGNFVNRIPAGTETEEGYMCPNCQMVECDECGRDTLDYSMKPEGGVICSDCSDPCPDDDDYPCSECGEPTDNGYDDGVCCQCLGEC
jgi:hypothetical protein